MTIALPDFIAELTQNPALFITVLLTLGVILVNGWTDAPNAIATCVSTRSMGVRPAIIMAAVFNFLGVLVMTAHQHSPWRKPSTTWWISAATPRMPWSALCAAMFAIVVWATAGLVVRYPHQRKPCSDRRYLRRRYRYPQQPFRH